jgi:hypothetical protein
VSVNWREGWCRSCLGRTSLGIAAVTALARILTAIACPRVLGLPG